MDKVYETMNLFDAISSIFIDIGIIGTAGYVIYFVWGGK